MAIQVLHLTTQLGFCADLLGCELVCHLLAILCQASNSSTSLSLSFRGKVQLSEVLHFLDPQKSRVMGLHTAAHTTVVCTSIEG